MLSLILEQNKTISNILQSGMQAYGYTVEKIEYTEDLADTLKYKPYKLVFIDRTDSDNKSNLGEIIKLAQKINKQSYIIGIVAENKWRDRVNFLNSGADEVITYPFILQEVLARIQTLLRRPKIKLNNTLEIGDVAVDTLNKEVYENNQKIDLRKKEYNILEYMIRNKERPISRTELLDNIWDYRKIINSNTVDSHISTIRKKLKTNNLIKTVHGIGYKIVDSSTK